MTPNESAWWEAFRDVMGSQLSGPDGTGLHWATACAHAGEGADAMLAELRKRREAGAFDALHGSDRERAAIIRDRDDAQSAGEHLARERDAALERAVDMEEVARLARIEHGEQRARAERAEASLKFTSEKYAATMTELSGEEARAEALKVRVSELEQARNYYGKNCRAAETRAEAAEDALDLERRTRTAEYDGRRRAESFLKEALGAPGDPDFILWTANRFVNVYGESSHYAHVGALRQRAKVILAVLAKAKAAGYGP